MSADFPPLDVGLPGAAPAGPAPSGAAQPAVSIVNSANAADPAPTAAAPNPFDVASGKVATTANPLPWNPEDLAANSVIVNPEAMTQLYQRTDQYVQELEAIQRRIHKMRRITGFESLESAKALQDMFNAKAHGGTINGADVYSAEKMIADRIRVAENIRDTIKKTAQAYYATDEHNQDALNKINALEPKQ